jgi:hypothetical protein
VVLLLEVQQSFLPTANTSTNTSNQRRANAWVDKALFDRYDYAFSNAYFGSM